MSEQSVSVETSTGMVEATAAWSGESLRIVHPDGSHWRDTESAIEGAFPFNADGYREVSVIMYGEVDHHTVTCVGDEDEYYRYRCRRCREAEKVMALYRQAEDRLREQFALDGLVNLTAAGNEDARAVLRIIQREMLARQAAQLEASERLHEALSAHREAIHLSQGMDAMLAWHDSMVQSWRKLSMRYASHGEWCSVYEQAMTELGIIPMYPRGSVTLTVEITVPIQAHRSQRYGASEDFVYNSLRTYDARDQIRQALSDYTFDPFDGDFQIPDDEGYSVGDISVQSVEWGE